MTEKSIQYFVHQGHYTSLERLGENGFSFPAVNGISHRPMNLAIAFFPSSQKQLPGIALQVRQQGCKGFGFLWQGRIKCWSMMQKKNPNSTTTSESDLDVRLQAFPQSRQCYPHILIAGANRDRPRGGKQPRIPKNISPLFP
jgi:hypothetical protein